MRKDLQKRVLVVAAALERLAAPADAKTISAQIAKISTAIANDQIPADKLTQANQLMGRLLQQLAQVTTQNAQPAPAAGTGTEGV
jgi:hypothetical protein